MLRSTMVVHEYLADKVAEFDRVVEDLECVAETPGDYEALTRLTDMRDQLRTALKRCRAERMLYV